MEETNYLSYLFCTIKLMVVRCGYAPGMQHGLQVKNSFNEHYKWEKQALHSDMIIYIALQMMDASTTRIVVLVWLMRWHFIVSHSDNIINCVPEKGVKNLINIAPCALSGGRYLVATTVLDSNHHDLFLTRLLIYKRQQCNSIFDCINYLFS